MLIDNRIIQDTNVASLDMLLQALPVLNHPQLRWIVVILPDSIKSQAKNMAIQRNGQIQLRYVDSLDRVFQHLREIGDAPDAGAIDQSFFDKN